MVDPETLPQNYKTSGRAIPKKLFRLSIALHVSFQNVHTFTHVSFHFNEWWKYHPHSTCEATNHWAITYQRYTICKSWRWESDHKGLPCSQVQKLFSSNELCLLRSQRFNESLWKNISWVNFSGYPSFFSNLFMKESFRLRLQAWQSKRQTMTSVGEDMQKLKCFYIVGGNVKWFNYFEK